jgi:hypothetical protein
VRSNLNLNEDTEVISNILGTMDDEDDSFEPTKVEAKPGEKGYADQFTDKVNNGISDSSDPAANALNGAQVTAIVDIVKSISVGDLPRESGIQVIISSFNKTREEAEAIVGEAGKGFKPANEEQVKKDVSEE